MDELQISGKRYISSRRIARENGYTADYIGQLIRGGKLAGQKVGRAWYVDASSFDSFLRQEPVRQVPPEQQVPSEESVQEVKTIIEMPAPEAEPILVAEPAPVQVRVQEIKEEEKPQEKPEEKQEEQPVRVTAKESGLRYYADEAPLLPAIASNSKASRLPESAATAPEVPHEVFSAEHTGGGARRHAVALAVLALIVFVITAVVSSTLALNINVGADNTASTFYTIDFKH